MTKPAALLGVRVSIQGVQQQMSAMVDIEVQDKFGTWRRYSTVENTEERVMLALQSAKSFDPDSKRSKARAVDQISKQVIAELERDEARL